jgi:hypothetical protein
MLKDDFYGTILTDLSVTVTIEYLPESYKTNLVTPGSTSLNRGLVLIVREPQNLSGYIRWLSINGGKGLDLLTDPDLRIR